MSRVRRRSVGVGLNAGARCESDAELPDAGLSVAGLGKAGGGHRACARTRRDDAFGDDDPACRLQLSNFFTFVYELSRASLWLDV